MAQTANDVPIGVHVASSDVPLGSGGRPRRRYTMFFTKTLSAAVPVDQILGSTPTRLYVLLQAGGANVIIAASQGTAQNAANTTVGQPLPQGMVLPYTNTAPTRIEGSGQLWAAAASYPAQVTVAACYEED